MNHRPPKRAILFVIAITLATLACSLVSQQTPETESPTPPTPTLQPDVSDQGLCSNRHFPVRNGATWTYASTGSSAGDYSFTETITDVRADGFTSTAQFDGLTRIQEWACKHEGLASLTFGGGAAAGVSTNDVQLDITTSNIQGVNIPKTIHPGDQWSYSMDFEGTINIDASGTSAEVQGTAVYALNALGEETVSTPAGTFNAMKIHIEMTLDMQIKITDTNIPTVFTSTSDTWFAPDVGWVKAVSTGELMGTPINETIELQSYNIP